MGGENGKKKGQKTAVYIGSFHTSCVLTFLQLTAYKLIKGG